MDATFLSLIRHGDTVRDQNGMRLSGWTDVPLSPEGREQVEQLAQRPARGPSFNAVYSSPLSRARETAEAIARGTQSVRVCDGLKEIYCGELEGMLVQDVEARFADLWQANLRQDDPNFRWPGGESYSSFRRRCLAALERIAQQHPGGRIAVVTHAGCISQVVGWMHGLSAAQWEPFRPSTASITQLEWHGGRPRLLRFNESAAP